MKEPIEDLKDKIIGEIELSNMKFKRKMRLLKLLDQAFRKEMGVFYLSDEELESTDILNRSM
jgi:hypothetical protein